MSFGRPDLLGLALLLPLLVALAVWFYARRRKRIAAALGDAALVRRLGAGELFRFPLSRMLLMTGAAAAIGFAAADPRWGTHVAEHQTSSLSLVLALDVSKSMLAEDVKPNRLETARLLARRLLRELPGDRMGLVVFAGRAYILSPLTVDFSALHLYLDALDPDIVSTGGSSLASALEQATDLVRATQEAAGRRVVLLVSDGEALEDRDKVIAAADRAVSAGVTIYTVGVGTTEGARVPERDPIERRITGYKRDESGNLVHSRMDDRLLSDIAGRTGGSFIELASQGAPGRLINELRGLERTVGPGGKRLEQQQRFALFVGLALLLLCIDMLLQRAARLAAAAERSGIRPATVTAMLFLSLSLSAWSIGDVERGNRLYRAGRYAEAVQAYQAALRDGKATPQVYYNLGTALLRLGRYDEAEQNLRRALDSLDPELRERALYNMGNRFLEPGRGAQQPDAQKPMLDAAIEAYRRALRLNPQDADAKWNLELALREKEKQQQNPQSGGGGGQGEDQNPTAPRGGGGSSDNPAQAQPQQAGAQDNRNAMNREQADRILSAVEQDERELTREKLKKGQRQTPVRRDW